MLYFDRENKIYGSKTALCCVLVHWWAEEYFSLDGADCTFCAFVERKFAEQCRPCSPDVALLPTYRQISEDEARADIAWSCGYLVCLGHDVEYDGTLSAAQLLDAYIQAVSAAANHCYH